VLTAHRCIAIALLDHMNNLMSEQTLAVKVVWCVAAAIEYDRATNGVGERVDGAGRLGGSFVGVDADPAQVGTESPFHVAARARIERRAEPAEDFTHDWGDLVSGATGRAPLGRGCIAPRVFASREVGADWGEHRSGSDSSRVAVEIDEADCTWSWRGGTEGRSALDACGCRLEADKRRDSRRRAAAAVGGSRAEVRR